jgi:hypothetical protein
LEEKNEQIRGELETVKKTAEQRDIDFQALETDLRGKLMTAKEENEASNTKRQELEEEKKNVFEELTAAKRFATNHERQEKDMRNRLETVTKEKNELEKKLREEKERHHSETVNSAALLQQARSETRSWNQRFSTTSDELNNINLQLETVHQALEQQQISNNLLESRVNTLVKILTNTHIESAEFAAILPVLNESSPESQAQGYIIGSIIYPNDFDTDKILVTISSAIPFLDQHPEYIPVLKILSARAAEEIEPALRILKLSRETNTTAWLSDEYKNVPLSYPPLLYAWMMVWLLAEGDVPDIITELRGMGLDDSDMFFQIILRNKENQNLNAVVRGRVDGTQTILYKYQDEIGWREGDDFVRIRADDVLVEHDNVWAVVDGRRVDFDFAIKLLV